VGRMIISMRKVYCTILKGASPRSGFQVSDAYGSFDGGVILPKKNRVLLINYRPKGGLLGPRRTLWMGRGDDREENDEGTGVLLGGRRRKIRRGEQPGKFIEKRRGESGMRRRRIPSESTEPLKIESKKEEEKTLINRARLSTVGNQSLVGKKCKKRKKQERFSAQAKFCQSKSSLR